MRITGQYCMLLKEKETSISTNAVCPDATGEVHNVKLTNILLLNIWISLGMGFRHMVADKIPVKKINKNDFKYHCSLFRLTIYLNYLPSGIFHSTNIFSIASVHFLSGHSGTQIWIILLIKIINTILTNLQACHISHLIATSSGW